MEILHAIRQTNASNARAPTTRANEIAVNASAVNVEPGYPTATFGLKIDGCAGKSNNYVYIAKTGGEKEKKFAIKAMNRDPIVQEPSFDITDVPAMKQIIFGVACSHPSIVRVYDFAHDNNTNKINIVTEYAKGKTLNDFLRQYPGGLHECQAVEIMWLLGNAIDYLHSIGIYHGDIKLENVIYDSSTQTLKLFDFDASGLISRDGEESCVINIGTLKNMPFEHLINFMESDSDMRIRTRGYEADLWGYSIVCFQLLTGRHPFPNIEQLCFYRELTDEHEKKRAEKLAKKILDFGSPCDFSKLVQKAYDQDKEQAHERLNHMSCELKELFSSLLAFRYDFRIRNPETQMTMQKVLCHSFFTQFRGFDYVDDSINDSRTLGDTLIKVMRSCVDMSTPQSEFHELTRCMTSPLFAAIVKKRRFEFKELLKDSGMEMIVASVGSASSSPDTLPPRPSAPEPDTPRVPKRPAAPAPEPTETETGTRIEMESTSQHLPAPSMDNVAPTMSLKRTNSFNSLLEELNQFNGVYASLDSVANENYSQPELSPIISPPAENSSRGRVHPQLASFARPLIPAPLPDFESDNIPRETANEQPLVLGTVIASLFTSLVDLPAGVNGNAEAGSVAHENTTAYETDVEGMAELTDDEVEDEELANEEIEIIESDASSQSSTDEMLQQADRLRQEARDLLAVDDDDSDIDSVSDSNMLFLERDNEVSIVFEQEIRRVSRIENEQPMNITVSSGFGVMMAIPPPLPPRPRHDFVMVDIPPPLPPRPRHQQQQDQQQEQQHEQLIQLEPEHQPTVPNSTRSSRKVFPSSCGQEDLERGDSGAEIPDRQMPPTKPNKKKNFFKKIIKFIKKLF